MDANAGGRTGPEGTGGRGGVGTPVECVGVPGGEVGVPSGGIGGPGGGAAEGEVGGIDPVGIDPGGFGGPAEGALGEDGGGGREPEGDGGGGGRFMSGLATEGTAGKQNSVTEQTSIRVARSLVDRFAHDPGPAFTPGRGSRVFSR
ncbi:MAG: hypothetical protein ACKO38_11365 [Planctomycetota bacterium]